MNLFWTNLSDAILPHPRKGEEGIMKEGVRRRGGQLKWEGWDEEDWEKPRGKEVHGEGGQ